jgi:hypothetical protein
MVAMSSPASPDAQARATLLTGGGVVADLGVGNQGGREPSGDRRHAAAVGRRRAGGPQYQEPGLAWLERQAEVAENLVTERQERGRHDD